MSLTILTKELKNLLEDYQFADVPVEELYKKVVPESRGSISFDEIDKVKEILGITGTETEEELRSIRNSIVKYFSDRRDYLKAQAEEDWNQEKAMNPNADFNEFLKTCSYDIRMDQMSAFTHVIDRELMNRFSHV